MRSDEDAHDEDDRFGKAWHDKSAPQHLPYTDGHWCDEWDGLFICEHCDEYNICKGRW